VAILYSGDVSAAELLRNLNGGVGDKSLACAAVQRSAEARYRRIHSPTGGRSAEDRLTAGQMVQRYGHR